MREFNYHKFESFKWDNEVLNYLALIHEYKGRQELFARQKPVELRRLVEVAKVQSIESSNRIEGIVTTGSRLGQIAKERTLPRSRNEKEIAGYRDVLKTIHESHDFIPVSGNVIRQFHRDLMKYSESGLGGQYKITQNYIKEIQSDGSEFIRFVPAEPFETEPSIDSICVQYKEMIESRKVDPLLIIPIFIHDFLCIHPFNDGNGRMSRLLTLLLLYQNGYEVGKYISIEMHIEKTKESYYEVLQESSMDWHKGKENAVPFIKYMLGVILACYRDFEEKIIFIGDTTVIKTTKGGKERAKQVRSSAHDIVKVAIDSRLGKFTKTDIVNVCPSISIKSVEACIRKMVKDGYLQKCGGKKDAFYFKSS